ncbi:hypothetical protein [uncultured Gemmiger sp.]|uniref:hypothetical protein n=1 Tax=uncultured Gemmiger sp. TaxID=1623490 RepID=UPI002600E449|nr:hypothetical protein [uncultured Gemmiger sp.]
MNKIKKFVAVLVSAAMACVFATCAFAAPDAETIRASVKKYLADNGIAMTEVVDSLTADQLTVLHNNADTLKGVAAAAKAGVDKSTSKAEVTAVVDKALADSSSILSAAGITVAVPTIEFKGDHALIGVSVAANGKSSEVEKNVAATASASAANPIASSSASVIKATGDNGVVALVAAALGVSAVLGMAVRKEHN